MDRTARDAYELRHRGSVRKAILSAEAVTVSCPYCGEPQPCHTGSEMWTPEDFGRGEPKRRCCSCDRLILILMESKVHLR